MKKAYLSPDLSLVCYRVEDAIMTSLSAETHDITDGDLGVRDVL